MKVENITLEKKYHDAVEHWRRHWLPDYDTLLAQWDKYFPKDDAFCLCAKLELGTPETVSIGEHQGEKKRLRPGELNEEEAKHLLAIIRAQASTEFGSIQQHAGTLARAEREEDGVAWNGHADGHGPSPAEAVDSDFADALSGEIARPIWNPTESPGVPVRWRWPWAVHHGERIEVIERSFPGEPGVAREPARVSSRSGDALAY